MTTTNRARRLGAALAALLVGSGVAGAQATSGPAVITGSVRSDQGQPLPNANVFITELGLSVGTNAGGVYTITIPAARVSGQAATLRARIFGYTPEARPIRVTAGTQRLDFNLKQDVNRLSAVVVTGVTGATETTKLPISVSQVSEKDMPVPGANALSQLQGKVPGVQIVSPTGRPGGSPAILLRGPQSINASGRGQSPLYIVDGVVISGGMPDINPLDIESIEVVKGAAASSLYGSRAGNGVINITTKSGKNANDGVRFNARVEYGRGDIEGEYNYAKAHFLTMDETRTRFCVRSTGCASTVDFEEEALRVNQNGGDFSLAPVNFEGDAGIAIALSKPLLRGTFSANRWPREYNPIASVISPGQFANTSIDATGRVGGTSFFASAADFRQQGAMKFLDGYSRQSLRLNLDQSIGTDWTFGLRTYYSLARDRGGRHDESGSNAFFRLTRVPAGVNLLRRDQFGRLFIRSNPLAQGIQNENPLYSFEAIDIDDSRNRFIGNFTTQYTPFSWLTLDGNLSYDRQNLTFFNISDKGYRATSNSPATHSGSLFEQANTGEQYNVATNATARKTWGDLQTRWNARYIYEQEDGRGISLSGSNLASPGLRTAGAVSDQNSKGIGSSESSIRSIGLMTGLDFEFKERYILSGLVRRDGSSLFGSENRWATYGRGSAAWRVSQEPWWFAPSALNELKLRGSLGTAGGRPSFSSQYETFSIGAGGALVPSTLGNKNLRPETVTETELGIDAEAWSRIGLTLNYAQSVSKDQILPVPPSVSSGFTNQWKNAGTLENKTWEASLNIPIIQKRNVNWTARFNYDRNRAVITKLDVPEFFGGVGQQGGDAFFKFAEGERYGTMYGRAFARNCADLGAFASQCGGAGSMFQKNNDGLIVWTGGQSLGDGITRNLWQAVNPGCMRNGAPLDIIGEVACRNAGGTVNNPFGVATNWGMPIIIRDSTGTARQMKLGQATPDYRISASQTFNYKKVFVYALLDGAFGQKVYNLGRAWSFGDYMTSDTDQLGKSVEEAKPIGYYWRAPRPEHGAGVGGLYDALGPNNVNVEDGSYAKIREVNLSYNVGPVRGVGDWTVSVIGRNLKTFSKYSGFDPEVGRSGGTTGSAVINSIDAYSFPNLRTFTFALNTRF